MPIEQAGGNARLNVSAIGEDDQFLARFHAGDRKLLSDLYVEYFDVVDRAVRRLLDGVDRETVIQEFWCRLIASGELRQNYEGGSPNSAARLVGARSLVIRRCHP
jgi:hypothetical protein